VTFLGGLSPPGQKILAPPLRQVQQRDRMTTGRSKR
jgi:hypothetical protein